jgi:two-component system OmpR family sensor kinase
VIRPGSLQRRLGIGLAAAVAAMWVLAAVAAVLVVQHELDEAFDSALQETAQRLLPLALMDLDVVGGGEGGAGRTVTAIEPHEEYFTYMLRDASGTILLQSHDMAPEMFPERPAQGFRQTASYRLYGETARDGAVFMEVAEPLAHREEAMVEAMSVLFVPPLILVPGSLFGVWWFVRRSLRPVVAFSAAIEERGGADLSPVLTAAVPGELDPVADAVNRLLDRLRRTLEAERSFTANSAHELRTPIAGVLAQTQRLIAEAPPGALRERARRIESTVQDLARLAEKLMQLAKAEGGGLVAEEPQDLSTVLIHVLDEFARSAGPSGLHLDMAEDACLMSRLDRDAFGILMRNLIENALRHGAADGPVVVSVPATRQISVRNAGPVVPPEVLARLKGRFERGAARTGGSGLGLAIVDTIAAGAGGELVLRSPARGRKDGFEAVLRLPA